MGSIEKLRIVLVGGTRRTLWTLKEIVTRDDIEVLMAIFQRDYPWDIQWHPKLEQFVQQQGIPFETYDSGESLKEHTIKRVCKLKPDVIIGGGNWRSLLTAKLWSTSRYGYIALHGSLLPEYRGWANINWYIINGEDEYGLQMFKLDEGIDSGYLVYCGDGAPLRAFVSLSRDRTMSDILDEVDRVNANLLVELLEHLKRDDVLFIKQDEHRATWGCHRGPEDGEIDWTRPTVNIFNFIRAQSHPYPGAFSFYNNQQFHIWRASIPEDPKKFVGRIPGKVVERHPSGPVDVLTGDGVLRIEEISVAGESIPPRKFLNSVRQTLGYKPRQAFEELQRRIEAIEKLLQK